jgi:hypothetical protein
MMKYRWMMISFSEEKASQIVHWAEVNFNQEYNGGNIQGKAEGS